MIPKIIHYCWFGHNPLPESAQKCIASWRKFFPDYEIWQWSEAPIDHNDNHNLNCLYDKLMGFDVNSIQYTREAYEAKKYAFVSDYARFWILYKYGGLYFDTDVEVIKSFDDIVERGAFMGAELLTEDGTPKVNPGLGLGVEKGDKVIKALLDRYACFWFKNDDGSFNLKTIVDYTTETLLDFGMVSSKNIQQVEAWTIYPVEYFNPFDDLTGKLNCTKHTRSIHWYSKTWYAVPVWRIFLSRLSHRLFGLRLHKLLKGFKKK